MEEKITKDMLIGDVFSKDPELAGIFSEEGFHCMGCQAAFFETIENGLAMHGKSINEIERIIKRLNKALKGRKSSHKTKK